MCVCVTWIIRTTVAYLIINEASKCTLDKEKSRQVSLQEKRKKSSSKWINRLTTLAPFTPANWSSLMLMLVLLPVLLLLLQLLSHFSLFFQVFTQVTGALCKWQLFQTLLPLWVCVCVCVCLDSLQIEFLNWPWSSWGLKLTTVRVTFGTLLLSPFLFSLTRHRYKEKFNVVEEKNRRRLKE